MLKLNIRQVGGFFLLGLVMVLLALGAGCAPAATPAPSHNQSLATVGPTRPPETATAAQAVATQAGVQATSSAPETSAVPETQAASETLASPETLAAPVTPPPAAVSPSPAAVSPPGQETPTALLEGRVVELEWPAHLRLGDSDVVRLSLAPTAGGYVVQAEFPEHPVQSQEVLVSQPAGFDLYGVARLDGTSFDLAPQGEQPRRLAPGETITWRWSLTPRQSGQHRLVLSLLLRWVPQAGNTAAGHESLAFSRALPVQVTSILGLTAAQAGLAGIALLLALVGGGIAWFIFGRRQKAGFQSVQPNPALALEPLPGAPLPEDVSTLLRGIFRRYARLVVLAEFHSGYSGSRTWLVLPVHADGRQDAQTIVKAGTQALIQAEYNHYETFVKDTLPPVTARIQQPPVRVSRSGLAGLRYTFIGQAGKAPRSLRQALLEDPDPAYLRRLFETFGPNWWFQRRPAVFRLAAAYDSLLPAHLVVEPCRTENKKVMVLDGRQPPVLLRPKVGSLVQLRHFQHYEPRADGQSLTALGEASQGQPPLRVRWLAPQPANGGVGKVVATREMLLDGFTRGFDLCGLADPLPRLSGWLEQTVSGSQSVIHGDLNLENILVGPEGLVWLIDFARTRLGHPLADFAHLEGEIIAHILACSAMSDQAQANQAQAETAPSAADFVRGLQQEQFALLNEVEAMAQNCLANPEFPMEYHLSLAVTCLGMLKYTNLTSRARHFLYLAAAWAGMRADKL